MRMDHHCPWAGNCIGLKNHKYFVCFMFWTIIACLHVAISSPLMNKNAQILPDAAQVRWSRQFYPFSTVLVPMLAIAVSFGVTFLFLMHIHFLYKNETTIESVDLGANNRYQLQKSRDNVS